MPVTMSTELSIVSYNTTSSFLKDYNTQASLARAKKKLPSNSGSKAVEKPRRTRRSHTKSRTGCLTCRVRHKRCDETKPICLQCSSTDRKCDGYARGLDLSQPISTSTQQTHSEIQKPCLLPDILFNNGLEVFEIHSDSGYRTPPNTDKAEDDQIHDFITAYVPGSRDPSTVMSRAQQRCQTKEFGICHSLTNIPRQPSTITSKHAYNDIASSCFSFFRHQTAPKFTSYFESSIWREYVVQGALAHPVLFDAAAAVGAAHRRFEYGISREAFEYCGYAARLYAKALWGLQQLKGQVLNRGAKDDSSMSMLRSYEFDLIMVTESLLGLFQGFQGNFSDSVDHLRNALGVLMNRPMRLSHRECRYYEVKASPATFHKLFTRISNSAASLFDTSPQILTRNNGSLPTIPERFTSLDQARDFLFTEVESMLEAPENIWSDQLHGDKRQNIHVTRLLHWGAAYAELVVDMDRTRVQNKACKLLKMSRNVAYLLLYMTLSVALDSHTFHHEIAGSADSLWALIAEKEEININLARCELLVDGIIDEESIFLYERHSLSFDSAIGPPQKFDNLPSSSSKTRHRVRTMLEKDPEDSSLWESLGAYGIAESISAIEEHAVLGSIRSMIPESTDLKWVDISFILEERRILLRYCAPDDEGLGLKWTQEWWTF